MGKYKNETFLQKEIMTSDKHQFLYGYDGSQRKRFLKDIERSYPIVFGKDAPMAVYLTDFGLPKVDTEIKSLDYSLIHTLATEYFNVSSILDVLVSLKKSNDVDVLNVKLSSLIESINKYYLNKDYERIQTVDGLIMLLNKAKAFYKRYYLEYLSNGVTSLDINNLELQFIDLDMFVSRLKYILENDCYIGMIVDKQDDISVASTKAINTFVSAKSNNVSMKIAVEPDNWSSYMDIRGQLIENTHDYSIIELDSAKTKADSVRRVRTTK